MKTLHKNSSWGGHQSLLASCLAGLALLLLPHNGLAQSVTLTNGGSTATVDLGSSTGLDSWMVDTSPVNQLDSEWFYYSINGGTAQAINSLGLVGYTVTGGNVLTATYANSQLSISIGYTLAGSGSGSGSADLTANNVTAISGSSATLANLNIYEYANFNLLQSFDNGITISQASSGPPFFIPGGYDGVSQSSGATALTETINSPFANFAEAGINSTVLSDILSGGNLSGPLSFSPTPGDNVAWGLEWTYQNVGPNSQENVIQDQTLGVSNVPEPSSLALLALGLGACGFKFARRRQSV
jgi:hypothetical protein